MTAAVAAGCGAAERPPPTGPVDWDEFLRLLDRHQVAPVIQRSDWLERADAPAEVRAAVGDRVRGNAMRMVGLLALQREALAALAAAGVPAVVLKGPAVAVDAYDDVSARAAGDLDILVAPAAVGHAIAVLRSAGLDWHGWTPPEDADRAAVGPTDMDRLRWLPLLRDVGLERDGLRVELHWRLFRNERLMPADPAWLARPRSVQARGIDVPTLPLVDEWRYLLVHGAAHRWFRLKWLADVLALALRRPELASAAALERTEREGYGRAIAASLIVAEAACGPFLTPPSRAWALGVRGTRPLVARSLSALAAARPPRLQVPPRALPDVFAHRLGLRQDRAYRLNELRVLLLEAGRAQSVEDPGLADLVAAPLSWARRSARRLARRR